VLCGAAQSWKEHAGHAELGAGQLGTKVRLHRELVADGYACPGCGSLLEVEVRWTQDEPLPSLTLGADRTA
jgi:N-methylhydantoinase B